MAEEPTDPPAAPSAGDPPAGSNPPADPPALGGGDPPKDPPKPDWPDDWRDKFVAKAKPEDREKLGKRLARFASPDNVLASYLELDRKVGAGNLKPTLADGATEEEVAAYRKAWGVPDKAEAYGIAFPEGIDVTDADKADLGDFLTTAHKNNIPAGTAKSMAEWYFGLRAKAEQQLYDAAHEQTINNRAAIKAEYGKDYDRNVKMANANLAEALGGPDRVKDLVSLTLADGTKLADHPLFVSYAVNQALKSASPSDLITSEYDAAGKSVADAYEEALNLKFSNPTKYHTPEHQQKLLRLRGALTQKQTKAA